jgi:hypothetical protein
MSDVCMILMYAPQRKNSIEPQIGEAEIIGFMML